MLQGALGLFVVLASCRANGWSDPEVKDVAVGGEHLSVVRFPGQWTGHDQGSGPTQILSGSCELRRSRSEPDSLLVALKSNEIDTSYSDEVYAVRLGPPAQVRPVSPQEWGRGTPVPRRRGELVVPSATPGTSVKFHGREYQGSTGARVFDVFPSPGGRWLALLSSK